MRSVSVVVPVFNEAESVSRLYEEITQTASCVPTRWQFVFVDDGSRARPRRGTSDATTRQLPAQATEGMVP